MTTYILIGLAVATITISLGVISARKKRVIKVMKKHGVLEHQEYFKNRK